MDTITADLQFPHPWTLLYADDVFLADEVQEDLQWQTQRWKTRLDENGMRLNVKKTEYTESGSQTNGTISVEDESFKKVTEFMYLGSTISSNGDITPDVRSRIDATWVEWRQCAGVLCDRRMPDHLKAKIYKTVVRPVTLYGSECWPAAAKHEQALSTVQMRMLRWCFGLTRWDHVTNTDVRKCLGIAWIVEKMREARVWWYGQITRSHENSVAKTVLRLDPEGQRPCGRPKRCWMDRINEDTKIVNVNPEAALDRNEWRRLCRHADPAMRD